MINTPVTLNHTLANMTPNTNNVITKTASRRRLFRHSVFTRLGHRLHRTKNARRHFTNRSVLGVNIVNLFIFRVVKDLTNNQTVNRLNRVVKVATINVKKRTNLNNDHNRPIINNISNIPNVPTNGRTINFMTMRARFAGTHLNTNAKKSTRTRVLSLDQNDRDVDHSLMRHLNIIVRRRPINHVRRTIDTIHCVRLMMRRIFIIMNTSVTHYVHTVVTAVNIRLMINTPVTLNATLPNMTPNTNNVITKTTSRRRLFRHSVFTRLGHRLHRTKNARRHFINRSVLGVNIVNLFIFTVVKDLTNNQTINRLNRVVKVTTINVKKRTNLHNDHNRPIINNISNIPNIP